ncbi:MAG TPA: LLM class flavin-dependent oxidoreductase [Candidatus Sulfotelmatobacter sp.]|nr:LLM class flavin-dependent oxidoreductase [Candidatus Sulfotelmatobacter sp.]
MPVRRRPLRVGVQLPEVEREVRWPELRAMARAAEAIGLDSLWVGDHLLYRWPGQAARGPWEGWSMLAALAAATERIQLGPLVAATSFRAPALLAKMAATVDEISGGRLILGLGAGWNETEYRAFGFPFDQRVARFEEAFTIIRTLLREGRIDFQGRFYEARDCELLPRGPQQAGPPLMVGSMGSRMLRITAPYVDAWNAWHDWFGNRPEGLGPLLATVAQAEAAAGRATGSIERTITALVALPNAVGRVQGDPEGRDTAPLSGDPAALAATLREYAAMGVGHVQLVLDPITVRSIEALGPMLERLDAG